MTSRESPPAEPAQARHQREPTRADWSVAQRATDDSRVVITLDGDSHHHPTTQSESTIDDPGALDAIWSQLRSAEAALEAGEYRSALITLVPLLDDAEVEGQARAKVVAQIGLTLIELRHCRAAVGYLDEAHAYYCDNGDETEGEVLRALVIACSHSNQPDAAQCYLEEYRKLVNAAGNVGELDALVSLAHGKNDQARKQAAQVVRTVPDASLAQLVLAQLNNRSGDHQAVIAMWTHSLQADNDERLLREVALAFERLGDFAAAYQYEKTAAEVAESRTLTLSMLGELIESDFGRFVDDQDPGLRFEQGGDPTAPLSVNISETAMTLVQAEVDELHSVIDRARRVPAHDEGSAHELAAELEGYVTRMTRVLEAARQPKPRSDERGQRAEVTAPSDTGSQRA